MDEIKMKMAEMVDTDGKTVIHNGLEFHLLGEGDISIDATDEEREEFRKKYVNTYEFVYPAGSKLECYNIPSKVNGKPVTRISSVAFESYNTSCLKRVIIPESITKIESKLFYAIVMKGKKIEVIIDSNNPSYKSIDGMVFTKDGKKLLYGVGKAAVLTIPDGVTTIAEYALADSDSYTGLVIPASVKHIERNAFYTENAIYFKGTKNEFKTISIDKTVRHILKQTFVYYYSETPSGNSWHYDADGVTPEITHTSIMSKIARELYLKKLGL